MFVGLHNPAYVFLGLAPETIHCNLPDGVAVNTSIPLVQDPISQQMRPSQCEIYENYTKTSNRTEKCPNGWYYSSEIYTIVTEFDLVCEKAVLVESSKTFVAMGSMVIAFALSLLADIFGRKTIFLADVPWAVGMMLLSFIGYFLTNWRHVILVTSVPFFTVVLFFKSRFLPESPPWLLARGRNREAKDVYRAIFRFNNHKMPECLQIRNREYIENNNQSMNKTSKLKQLKDNIKSVFKREKGENKRPKSEEASKDTVIDLLKVPKLAFYLIVSTYMFITLFLVYFGVTFNTGSLSGSLYVNFFLGGVVEIPSVIICVIGLRFIGRKPLTAVTFAICGISLFGILIIYETGKRSNLVALEMTLAMICRFAITAAFRIAYLYVVEIFPTTLRSTALNIAFFGGKIGLLMAPYTSYVAKILPWVPLAVFGVMSILAALLTLTLPETRGKPMPTTIAECISNTNQGRKPSGSLDLNVITSNNSC